MMKQLLIKLSLHKQIFMEIITLGFRSIWTERNDKIFQNERPTIQNWKRKLNQELSLVIYRANQNISSSLKTSFLKLPPCYVNMYILLIYKFHSRGQMPYCFTVKKLPHKLHTGSRCLLPQYEIYVRVAAGATAIYFLHGSPECPCICAFCRHYSY
jgi:hypothetical protein